MIAARRTPTAPKRAVAEAPPPAAGAPGGAPAAEAIAGAPAAEAVAVTPAAEAGPAVTSPQHRLAFSILLHLLPGAALTLFMVLAAPAVRSLGFPVVFALFAGIGLVIVPIELGYLLAHAKRTTGSFSLASTVTYRERLPARQLAGWTVALFAWFMVCFVASTLWLDDWLAATFFAWMPEAILQFSAVADAGEPATAPVLLVLLVTAFVFNGVVGPLVEELYFRGHLLPRIDRFGRWAPVLNTTLFSLYHFWTPWQNPARILGFLPVAWMTWRKRSVQLSAVAHIVINLVFLLGMLGVFLGAVA